MPHSCRSLQDVSRACRVYIYTLSTVTHLETQATHIPRRTVSVCCGFYVASLARRSGRAPVADAAADQPSVIG